MAFASSLTQSESGRAENKGQALLLAQETPWPKKLKANKQNARPHGRAIMKSYCASEASRQTLPSGCWEGCGAHAESTQSPSNRPSPSTPLLPPFLLLKPAS